MSGGRSFMAVAPLTPLLATRSKSIGGEPHSFSPPPPPPNQGDGDDALFAFRPVVSPLSGSPFLAASIRSTPFILSAFSLSTPRLRPPSPQSAARLPSNVLRLLLPFLLVQSLRATTLPLNPRVMAEIPTPCHHYRTRTRYRPQKQGKHDRSTSQTAQNRRRHSAA
jgi:hypothetical protein